MTDRIQRNGFTLVEVIASVVVAGVAIGILLVFMSRSLTMSHQPRESLHQVYRMQATMERIIASREGEISTLMSAIGPEGSAQQNDFGNYVVVRNRYVAFNEANQEINDDGSARLVRVTIQNPTTGETMTRLFTFRP